MISSIDIFISSSPCAGTQPIVTGPATTTPFDKLGNLKRSRRAIEARILGGASMAAKTVDFSRALCAPSSYAQHNRDGPDRLAENVREEIGCSPQENNFMMPLEDLPSLALFARVVQLRSFSAAARDLSLAKSAVSKRVAQLEARLGVRLLNRSTRTLSLTDEGMRFYEHCAAMLASANAAEEAVAALGTKPTGTLRVNAPVTFAQTHLAPAVAAFLAEHPGLTMHLSVDDRLIDVVEGGFDVVVRISRLPDSSLHARKIATDRVVICASPAYLARAGTPATPEELVHHNCLHYDLVPASVLWSFPGANGPVSIPVRGNFLTTDGTVLRRAACAGLGLCVLPSHMVARDVAQGRLRLVLEGFRHVEVGIYALFAHRMQMPLRTKAFLDFLVMRFSRARWEDDPLAIGENAPCSSTTVRDLQALQG